MYKMYAIISKEAVAKSNGIRGKMITQGGHAYLHAAWDAEERFPDSITGYKNSPHARKITLVVDSDQALYTLLDAYKDVCGVSLVTDAGFTVFDGPTVTCLGIGPIREDQVNGDLKKLRLFI